MNKGHFLIIANHMALITALKHPLKAELFTAWDSPLSLSYNRIHGDSLVWRVPFWRNGEQMRSPAWFEIDQDARVHDAGLELFVTEEDSAESIRAKLRPFLKWRRGWAIAVFRMLREQYPTVTFTLTRHGPNVFIRMTDPRLDTSSVGIDPFNVPHADIQTKIKMASIQAALSERYPHLRFSVMWSERGVKPAYDVTVWVRSDGVRRSNIATGLSFVWPLGDVIDRKLGELEIEARQANEPEHFFCTKCHRALPADQFAGFLFAEHRCNGCADDEWRKRAQAENYN